MLSISEATGGYKKVTIIKNASISVGEGEIVALLGRNGVGKTTLIKYAMGLIDSFGGTVSLQGEILPKSTSKRVKMGLGYVPQGRFVFPRMSVPENIAVAAIACGHDWKAAVAQSFVDFPILEEKKSALAGSLSGGQQQILAIARALATKPKVLILDEPTEGVQPSIIDEIAGILKRLNEERGLSIIVAEQDLDFCLSLAERAYVIDGGTIAQETTKQELLQNKTLLHELLGV
ncbi:MAG: ABC transporter ATP-binding protein [Spirochaetales bacterium]|jgi:urea transport system ATP-binding protein|nr:ABC transporter ATP-binding protein [Spirochaetales bacterium]